ncbi:MAG: hypothetical protein GY859_14895, partial [Desulfobacterales bacterium]|nr:hypothetical protein [Desulfobacterales bacterium]
MKFEYAFDIGGEPAFNVIQDREGFLWFTSFFNGLVRYDGSGVKYFRAGAGSISNDFTTQIFEDGQGVLWIGTNHGLNRYDKKTNSFRVFLKDPEHPRQTLAGNVFPHSARTIIEDRGGFLWFGTDSGLSRFDRRTETFLNFQHDPNDADSLPGNNIRCVLEDERGDVWVATRGAGIARIEKSGHRVTRYTHNKDDPDSIPANDIYAMVEDDEGFLWLGSKSGG